MTTERSGMGARCTSPRAGWFNPGQVLMTVQLSDILATSLAGERLLLSLRDGDGLTIDLSRPRTFRTEVAAAMRAKRT